MSTPVLTVIVCTYNRAPFLQLCLESVAAQIANNDDDDFNVIVVDNNSSDGTAQVVDAFVEKYDNFTYLFEPAQGLSHARNAGYKAAQTDFVAYLDDDATASSGWVGAILDAFANVKPEPLAVGGLIVPWYESTPPSWFTDDFETRKWGDHAQFLPASKARYGFAGGNLALNRSLLAQLGGFSTSHGMVGGQIRMGEETDLFHRIAVQNKERLAQAFWYEPRMKINHWTPVRNFLPAYRLQRARASGQAAAVIEGSTWGAARQILFAIKVVLTLPVAALKATVPKTAWMKARFSLAYVAGYLGASKGVLRQK